MVGEGVGSEFKLPNGKGMRLCGVDKSKYFPKNTLSHTVFQIVNFFRLFYYLDELYTQIGYLILSKMPFIYIF